MTKVFRTSEAKSGGWQQVRDNLTKFECVVTGVVMDSWGGTALGDDGKPLPPKEYFEVKCSGLKPLVVSEPLEMDVEGQDFSFRINMSESKGSFWIDNFVASAEKNNVQLPDGLTGKLVIFTKDTKTFYKKDGSVNTTFKPQTNYVIEKVTNISGMPTAQVSAPALAVVAQVATTVAPATQVEADPMVIATGIADGRTEAEFREVIAMHPNFMGTPLLAFAKAGALTQTLVNEGKIKLGADGKYHKG